MFYQLLLLHRSSPKEAERKLEKTRNAPESLVATACKSFLKLPFWLCKGEKASNRHETGKKRKSWESESKIPETERKYSFATKQNYSIFVCCYSVQMADV